MPARTLFIMANKIKFFPATFNNGLGVDRVKSPMRSPRPAAKIMARMITPAAKRQAAQPIHNKYARQPAPDNADSLARYNLKYAAHDVNSAAAGRAPIYAQT